MTRALCIGLDEPVRLGRHGLPTRFIVYILQRIVAEQAARDCPAEIDIRHCSTADCARRMIIEALTNRMRHHRRCLRIHHGKDGGETSRIACNETETIALEVLGHSVTICPTDDRIVHVVW